MNDENLLALQTICSSIQSLLGPSKSLKCCLSSDPNDDGLISDPFQLVEVLVGGVSESHPVVQLVHEACQDQRKACGCGVTTLVCMATYWARGVARLIQEGIPAPVVFDILEETISLCENTLLSLKLPLKTLQHQTTAAPQPTPALQSERTLLHFSGKQTWKSAITGTEAQPASSSRRNVALAYSRHFSTRRSDQPSQEKKEAVSQEVTSLNGVSGGESRHAWIEEIGDKLSSGKPVAMQLARDVVEIQLAAADEIWMRYVLHHSTLGKDKESSHVVHGVVMDIHPEMFPIVAKQGRSSLRVVVIDGDCTPSHTHLGLQKRTHVTSHDFHQLYECSPKVNWLRKCTEILTKLKIGVIVVGGTVSPLLWEYSIASGIVVLKGVAKQQLEGVCQVTGATPLSYLTHCLERHVGCHTVELTAKEWGWTKPSFVVKGQRDRHFERRYICTMKSLSPGVGVVATVIICAKTEWLVNILKQNFLNCLHRLKLAFEEGYLIPGGGLTEADCVSKLREKLSQLNSELSRTDLNSPDQRTAVTTSFAMATSWMSDWPLLACWRPHVYEVCIDGLMQYIARVLINCSCSGDTYVAMATAEEFVKKVLGRGEKSVWTVCNPKLLDVAKSKMAAWRRAVELLRLVFLSTRVQIHKEAAVTRRW